MSGASSEVRDGMRIDWDAPIETDDGVVLRAGVHRSNESPSERRYPVTLGYGPYAKGLAIQHGYPGAYGYEWQTSTGARLSNFKNQHLGDSYLLLPVIP